MSSRAPRPIPPMTAGDLARFRAKVHERGPDQCWPWTAARNRNGYGLFQLAGGMRRAHRVAFFLAYGQPHGLVTHDCDNPPCCNPAHLLDDTQAGNMRGGVKRGRPIGTPKRRLTASAVRTIRRRYSRGDISQRALADKHGVTVMTINHIVNRKTWRHVT